MDFFWPTKLKAEPSGIARLGRVLHWMALIAAITFLGAAGWLDWLGQTSPNNGWTYESYSLESAAGALLLPAMAATGIYLAGRAVRYVLAGE